MDEQCFVEIVLIEDDEVVQRLGPNSRRRAVKIENGININLNHEDYYTRIVPAGAGEEEKDGDPKNV